MAKFLVLGLIGILIGVLAACGGNGDGGDTGGGGGGGAGQAATVAPTTAPATQAAPEEATKPAVAETTATLKDVAAKLAGGPGAIYAGDVNQLAGAAVDPELGWQPTGGDIPANLLKESEWIYTSDYYNKLLEKANLENPTKLVSSGESFKIQYACINRALFPCKMKEKYFIPNVYERTNGQVDISVVGYPELGIAGPDTISLVANGTLSFAEITGAYVGGDLPVLDMYYFWGLFQDRETDFKAVTAVLEDLDGYIEEATGGGTVVTHNWYAGHDQWFFSREPLNTLGDYEGKRTRSHGTTMSDLINGMGMEAQFVAFAEVYTALERGILDAGATGGGAAFGQRWYEVTNYIVGPIISMPADLLIFNGKVWDSFPPDIQQILLEEGAKEELEELRIAPVWNARRLQDNIDAGMKLIEWDQETREYILNEIVLDTMIPNWVGRVGGYDTEEVRLFNEKFGPIAGVQVNPDGSASLTGAMAAASPAGSPLAAYAAEKAGGPGAIYVGDLNQLVGPASHPDLGDADGNVPLSSLEYESWIFTSDYYQELLEKARIDDPTPLVTSGESFEIQYACINRALLPCKAVETFLVPNVLERTNGQVDIQVAGYPELGIAGPDTLELVENGTLSLSEITASYVAGDLPALEVEFLWGLYPDHETFYEATAAIVDDLDALIADRTDGGKTIVHLWYAGVDQFFFCRDKITSLEDFKGKKTRSHGSALSDWIDGMGAQAQFVAFAEVYTALERGILDCGVTGADPAYGQRWYEVTEYMIGPLPTFTANHLVFNRKVWEELPADIQQILIEEGAKHELESLRLSPIQNLVGVPKNVATGLELIEFTPEINDFMVNEVVLKKVVPNWVKRAGGPDSDAVKLFNEKVAPIVGVTINSQGEVEGERCPSVCR